MNLDKCPYCGKKIIIGATQCPFCGEDLSDIEPPEGFEARAQSGPQPGPSEQVPPPPSPQYAAPQNGPQYYYAPQYRQFPMPSITEAFKTCFLKKYANFHGRARRSEYWWFYLVYYAISLLVSILAFSFIDFRQFFDFSSNSSAYELRESLEMLRKSFLYNPGYWLSIVVSLAFLLPNLAACVRRLHDIGKSGTVLLYFLFGLIPLLGAIFILVYGIILLVWMCTDGQKGPNKWGPSPKYYLVSHPFGQEDPQNRQQ